VGALTEPYSYDPHGNMTSMLGLPVLAWDFKDQLQTTSRSPGGGPQPATWYRYDQAGKRVRKISFSATGIPQSERIYFGDYEVYREYDNTGTLTLERQTVIVPDGARHVALVETTQDKTSPAKPPSVAIRYQLDNHLGSACLEVNENAAVLTYEEYFPYGATSFIAGLSAAEVSLKRYRYTGKERDAENGLSYHGARYYASWIGRWTAPDALGITDGVNVYAYTRDNPVARIDPTGNAVAVPEITPGGTPPLGGVPVEPPALPPLNDSPLPNEPFNPENYIEPPSLADEELADLVESGTEEVAGPAAAEGVFGRLVGPLIFLLSLPSDEPGPAQKLRNEMQGFRAAALSFLRRKLPLASFPGAGPDVPKSLPALGPDIPLSCPTAGSDAPRSFPGLLPSPDGMVGDPPSDDEMRYEAQSAKELGEELERNQEPKPDDGWEAHHIVARNAKWAQKAVRILDRFNIPLDSAINGVWLPGTDDVPNPGGAMVHRGGGSGIHSKDYYEAINSLLGEAAKLGIEAVKASLQMIKDYLSGRL